MCVWVYMYVDVCTCVLWMCVRMSWVCMYVGIRVSLCGCVTRVDVYVCVWVYLYVTVYTCVFCVMCVSLGVLCGGVNVFCADVYTCMCLGVYVRGRIYVGVVYVYTCVS